MEKHFFRYDKPIRLEGGGTLPEVTICYHINIPTKRDLSQAPVVWICHALTANSNPQEWWPTLVGEGLCFDTESQYIICANILGSCYGTTGPLSINPKTGYPYYLDFPVVSVRDIVMLHNLLREHLHIKKIDLLVGGSNGGFQALEWAISSPKLIKQACFISTNARTTPWMTAFNESQRMALFADPTFKECLSERGGEAGLATARSIAMISYRCPEGYFKSQSEDDQECFIAQKAASYQRYQGKKLAERFNAYSYYLLTLNIDTHNVGRGRGGVKKALSMIEATTLCLGIESDLLFPLKDITYIADNIPGAKIEVISSDFGHDGFLLEHKQIKEKICKYLNLEAVQ